VKIIRGWLSPPWVVAALLWTAPILLLIALNWAAATAMPAPCGYQGDPNRDLSLPPCPMDDVNVAAVFVVLLALLWIVGMIIVLLAYAISRLARRWRPGAR
jgi:hypothetical protein